MLQIVKMVVMHSREEIKNILERHFKEISDVYGIEMAFFYGSWARGFPEKVFGCYFEINSSGFGTRKEEKIKN